MGDFGQDSGHASRVDSHHRHRDSVSGRVVLVERQMTAYCVECGEDFEGVEDVRDRFDGTVHRACELLAQAIEATAGDTESC